MFFAGMRALIVVTVFSQSVSAQSSTGADTSINFVAAPAPAAASGVSAHSNKKIRMVTETLKDILQSIVSEERQESDIHANYMSWCKSETAGLASDLKETRSELQNAKVLSMEQVSSIADLKLYLTKSEKEIDETKDAIAQAVALRNAEKDKYTEEMNINTQSLRQIDSAIHHVGKVQQQGGFLQNGMVKKLQLNRPGESNYVLGVMKGLNDKLQKSRVQLETTEADQVKMYNSFMETKGSSLQALGSKRVEKKILTTETSAKEGGVKIKIVKLTEEVDRLVGLIAKTEENCQSTHHEWGLRVADRTKEKAALSEAIRYLVDMMAQPSLLQGVPEQQSEASVVFAPDFLQEVTSKQISENAFFKAAGAELDGEDEDEVVQIHMKKDTFNGVKSVVQKLIGSHEDSQKEEETKKQYCQKEMAAKDDERTTTTDDLAALRANIDKKAAEVDMLADELKKVYESMAQVKTSVEDAGKLRKEENGFFAASSKDRALAVKVLNQAKAVLQNFYDEQQGNLLQEGAAAAPAAAAERQGPPVKWTKVSPRQQAESFGVVSMVQGIADDIKKEQASAAMQEKQAAEAFAQMQVESRQSIEDKQQDVIDRVTAKAKLGVQINSLMETENEKASDLDSISRQLDGLHHSCDDLLHFYDKKKKDRTFEVHQLKDVMDILSGSAIAARTGLVQDQDSEESADEEEEDEFLEKSTKALVASAGAALSGDDVGASIP